MDSLMSTLRIIQSHRLYSCLLPGLVKDILHLPCLDLREDLVQSLLSGRGDIKGTILKPPSKRSSERLINLLREE